MGSEEVFEPVSLGFSCEVKYQLARELYFRKFPDGAESEFRRMLMGDDGGERVFERHLFDFQITPFEAVLAYLEADFEGVFEREDLYVDGAEVAHRRLRTRHPHEFHPVGGVLDEAAIDRQYADAHGKFEHLAERFRRHLLAPGPFLYAFNQVRIHDDAARLIEQLRARNPQHRFKILFVGTDGDDDQVLTALEGEVFKAWTAARPDKPDDRRWEGDDARWSALLRPFALRAADPERIKRTLNETLPPEPPLPAPPRGWLGRLFGR